MALKMYKPITPGLRFSSGLDYSGLTRKRPEKRLINILSKKSGRNDTGVVTTRHQGAREKRFLREIDWKRNKDGMTARVIALEYDPNRTANIALLQYANGEKNYILAPEGLKTGQQIMSGEAAPLVPGNTLPLSGIPVGTMIHNLEVIPGKGAQIVRSAGSAATIMGFEEANALVKLPSGEIRRFLPTCRATIGQLSNVDWKNINFGKAGRRRHMGIRPTVRGTAQNPRSHPHSWGCGWANVWIGVSVENQETADERIPLLLQIPAAIRFLSLEPLLGPIDLSRIPIVIDGHIGYDNPLRKEVWVEGAETAESYSGPGIDWVIVGGESGPKARPMHPAWVRSIREQCVAAGVPFFFKQHGAWRECETDDYPCGKGKIIYPMDKDAGMIMDRHYRTIAAHGTEFVRVGKKAAGRMLDGRTWEEMP